MSKPSWVKELAGKRIKKLFNEAEEQFPEHPERSRRYIEIAHKISEKYNIPISKDLKRKFCPNCYSYWVPGETVKVRIDSENNRVIYICNECEGERTYGYSEEKLGKNNQ